MMKYSRVLSIVALAVLLPASLAAQQQPGRSIGKVKMIGNLIHLELDSGAVTPGRLFDMDHRTLRFIPEGGAYRVENIALKWDSEFGPAVPAGAATLANFAFPFAGKMWNSVNIASGSVTFSDAPAGAGRAGRAAGAATGGRGGGAAGGGRSGFQMERYPTLQNVGREFINTANGIAAFVKPGLNGERFMKELADRVVITWNLSEGAGGIQAFTWVRTVNRIQATLHKDGLIEISYNDVSARDAVVGVFPTDTSGAAGIAPAVIDLSTVARSAGPFKVAYEGFHWTQIPRARDVTCSIINALGDKFDLVVHYSDFRVDNPEGGTPSTGPRGGNISGIGTNTGNTEAYCSKGQLQWMYAQPVSMAAVQSQEKSPDGRMTNYNYAMSQVGHELGHRWAANASALVNGERIVLGPTHWQAGVHLPAAFHYTNPNESDPMGGSTWKENPDGTYTQLDRDYYSPAKGWSWLALYLMGLAKPEEVKPFFILRNLQRTGQNDAEGHPIYRGDKTVITIENVIAAMGPRVPAFENSQKVFNTAMIVMTLPGKQPTPELLTAANNISARWIPYWSTTTGGRSTMTVNGQPVAGFQR